MQIRPAPQPNATQHLSTCTFVFTLFRGRQLRRTSCTIVNMKAVAAMLVLLALVVAATTVVNADHDGHHHQHHGSHSWRHGAADKDGHHRSTPLSGLTQCVTVCGSRVTSCMLDCYQPLVDLDPVQLPVCLLNCTNDAMVCASGCPVSGNNV